MDVPRIHINEWPPYAPSNQNSKECSLIAARLMMNAAQTAPVTGGVDQVEGEIVYGYEELDDIARKMEELAYSLENKTKEDQWKYEAVMVRETDVLLLLGDYRAKETPMDSGCGMCTGTIDCGALYEKRRVAAGQIDNTDRSLCQTAIDGPLCGIRVVDFGHCVGSALWMTKTLLVDCRPFLTMGIAGQKLGYCRNSEIVIGLPIATTSKNPYVDIHPDYHVINMEKMIDTVRKTYIIPRQGGPDYRLRRLSRKPAGEEEEE
jgi:uncharacterized ferredoxin-like protein